MNNALTRITQASCLALALGAASGAVAQGQYGADQDGMKDAMAEQAAAMQDSVSDQALKQFVKASEEVGEIRDKLMHGLNEVEDQQAAQTLQQEAQAEMIEAVEGSGLDVDTYNRIAGLVQSDPAIRERIEELR